MNYNTFTENRFTPASPDFIVAEMMDLEKGDCDHQYVESTTESQGPSLSNYHLSHPTTNSARFPLSREELNEAFYQNMDALWLLIRNNKVLKQSPLEHTNRINENGNRDNYNHYYHHYCASTSSSGLSSESSSTFSTTPYYEWLQMTGTAALMSSPRGTPSSARTAADPAPEAPSRFSRVVRAGLARARKVFTAAAGAVAPLADARPSVLDELGFVALRLGNGWDGTTSRADRDVAAAGGV